MNNTPTDLPVREMARRLGLAPSMVMKLRDAGMPMHCEVAAAQWRTEHVAPRPGTAKSSAAATGAAAPARYAPWRARRERALALQAEIELYRLRHELVVAEDAKAGFARALVVCKEALLSLPPRLAPVLAAETDPAAVEREMYVGIYDAIGVAQQAALAAVSREKGPDDEEDH